MKELLRAAGFGSAESASQSGPVGRKLLLPITGGMAALLLILAGGLYWLYTENYERQAEAELTAAAKLYQYTAINYKDTMSGIVGFLSSDSRALHLLRDRDKKGLFDLYEEAFAAMREACGLTYLLFADEAHRVLVRVHDPDDLGDIIRRESFSLAERDGVLVTTLDAGSDGKLSLRVVASVQLEGRHVGFIEAGTEVEQVLAAATQPGKTALILALDKGHVSAERIKTGLGGNSDTAFWVDPGGGFFMYTTLAGLDADFARALLHSQAEAGVKKLGGEFSLQANEKRYMVSSLPLADSAGDRLGDLFVLYDTTPLRNELVTAALILLGAILAVAATSRLLIARKLRDTDADLAGMRSTIEEGDHIFENIFAESDTSFILRDADTGTVLKANAAALAAFAVTRAEDIEPACLIPLAADDPMQQAWQTSLLTIRASGGARFFEKSHFSAGHNERLECIALHEVTDGVLLQYEDRAHIVFLQTVINQLPGWVCIKDSSLRLVRFNDTFKALFGRGGEPTRDVRHSEWLGRGMDILLEADQKALSNGLPVTFELTIPAEPGGQADRTFVVTKQRFTGKDGQIHILSTGTDITERVQMLEQITALHQKAEEGSRAKTRFIARMSHELRTPLNGISGMSYLALKLTPEGQLRTYMAKIQESSEGLLKIITDILNFSEMEAGEARLRTGRFDLSEELETVGEQVRLMLQQKAVIFELEASGAGGEFIGDAARVRQALLLLCSNAVKFTENGTIRLRCFVTGRNGKYTARFAVEDSGIGIAGEHLECLFDSFSQVDGGVTRRFGGIGLGLTMASQAVALMGGRLEVESTPGRGSCFFFSIPLERSGQENETFSPKTADVPDNARPASGEAVLPPGRVLVVEDNEVNQLVVVELLEQAGLQTQTAGNGQEAVNIIKAQPFDLVLMDLQMPVMGGIEATRQIRELASGTVEKLPIIALTANAQESDRIDCAKAGMNDFLSKPINIPELYAKLRQWLPGSGRSGPGMAAG